eukprot:403353579
MLKISSKFKTKFSYIFKVWVLVFFIILNFQQSLEAGAPVQTGNCFNSNQFPLYFEGAGVDLRILIIKVNSDQSFVFGGQTKVGSVFNAAIGFYNNVSPLQRTVKSSKLLRLANSFLAGGSYADGNKNYLTIYGFNDLDTLSIDRWLYKAADNSQNLNVIWGIKSIELDYINNYIAGCYHTSANDRMGVIFQQWGTTVFKNYELVLNGDKDTSTGITTLGVNYLTHLPISTSVFYDSTVYMPDVKLSYTLGHMTSPTYSTYASFIFALDDDNRNCDYTYSESNESGVAINEDLRKYQIQYSNTQGNCNLAGKLGLQSVNGTYAFSERVDCYYEQEFCDMPIATYALKSSDLYTCLESQTVNFQFLQSNDTSIIFANKNISGSNEYSLSLNRSDLVSTSNIIALKKYEIMVRASFYYPDDFQFAVDSSIKFQLYYKSCYQEVKDSLYFNAQDQNYYIGGEELQFLYMFEQSTVTCGSYTAFTQTTPTNTFITVHPIYKSVSIQTNDVANAGTYFINIQVNFVNNMIYDPPDLNITTYTIKIVAKAFVKNNPPYFSTGQLLDQTVTSGTQRKYKLPEVIDWENDDYVITLMSTSIQSFTTLIGDEFVFNPSSIYVGVYKVEIKLTQKKDTSLQNIYRFKLTVLKQTSTSDPNQDGVEQENEVQSSDLYNPETDAWSDSKYSVFSGDDKIIKDYLKAKISYISGTGEMTIIFDKQMMIPTNYSFTLNDRRDIEVTAIFSYQSSVYFIHLDSYDLASSVATAVSVTMSTVFGTNFVLNLILQNFSMSLIILLQWTKLVVTLEHV